MEALKSVGKILDDLKAKRFKPGLASSLAVPFWEEIVGKAVAVHSRPAAFKNKSLLVVCDSSVWCSELESHKTSILEKASSMLGPSVIKDIKLVVKRESKHTEKTVGIEQLPKIDERKFAWAESIAMKVPKPMREAFIGAVVGSIVCQQRLKTTFDKSKKPPIKGAGGFR